MSPEFGRALTWSADSRITAITDNIDPYASQSFGYDQADRLTSATGSYGSISYSYDANGNRLSRTDGAGTVSSSYEANSNRLATASTTTFTRDAAGNRLTDNNFSYSYGVNNRLIAVADSLGNPIASYIHNGRGERTSKTVNGVTTYFFYDQAGNIIGEYDASGNVIAEYLYGPSGRFATITGTGTVYFHHNDHLGTPTKMTDSNGTVVWTMTQTPFGIATVNEDPDGDGITVTNNFRFPGQYYDAETGLNYNYYRTYDPGTGYTQSDPIGLNGGMNTFAYVNGNPISWYDPLGLWGFAIDFGGSYGTGFGGEKYSDSGAAATGIYIGGRDTKNPNQRGGYAEIGGFIYQAKGTTEGAKIGLGITLTHYKIDADNFFKGTLNYRDIDVLGLTYTKFYDVCGDEVGWAWSFGKGIGLAKGKGKVRGWSAVLQ